MFLSWLMEAMNARVGRYRNNLFPIPFVFDGELRMVALNKVTRKILMATGVVNFSNWTLFSGFSSYQYGEPIPFYDLSTEWLWINLNSLMVLGNKPNSTGILDVDYAISNILLELENLRG